MEKFLLLLQIGSQLTGLSVTVSGSAYLVTGWGRNKEWERAQVRAEKAGVSLRREDYRPADLPEEDDLLQDPVFLKEVSAPREERLESWGRLPGVSRRHHFESLRPAVGETIRFRNYFEEKMGEEEARKKLAEMAGASEKRLDTLSGILLAKPRQAAYAKLDADDQEESSSYILAYQRLLGSYESSALMAMRSGDPAGALRSIEVIERFSDTFRRSNLIGVLLQRAGESVVDRLIWEGIRLRVWNDVQLEKLEVLVSRRTPEESGKEAFEGEAAWMIDLLENGDDSAMTELLFYSENYLAYLLHFGGSRGWGSYRKAYVVNYYLDLLEWLEEDVAERPPILEENLVFKLSPLWGVKASLNSLARPAKTLSEEWPTKQRLVLIAIACERHFLKGEKYPETLADLKVKFQLTDLTDSELRDLSYKLGPQGRPVIWSRAEEAREKEVKRRKLRWQFYKVKKLEPKRGRGN